MRHTSSGFTLLELAVVLVIIALLAGGILMGRDLVQAAEHRKIHKKFEDIMLAIAAFQLSYDCVPGDCPDATTLGLGNNGNGDKIISVLLEPNLAMQHLGNAGLISINTGVGLVLMGRDYLPTVCDLGFRVVDADLSTFTGYEAITHIVAVQCFMSATRSLAEIGGCRGMYQYDLKYDDGLPNSGRIIVLPQDDLTLNNNYCVVDAVSPHYDINALPLYDGLHVLIYRHSDGF